jgi:hypothetical protein
MRVTATVLLVGLFLPIATLSAQGNPDAGWQPVAEILQSGPTDGGGYVRFNLPRSDLSVRVGDVRLVTGMAMVSWAGFSGTPDSAMAMGDLVLTTSELGPVVKELTTHGVAITAIHNHLEREIPQIVFVHFHAGGSATDIAHRLDGALRLTGTPRPVSAPTPGLLTIDSAAVFEALGRRGRASGALAQVSVLLVSEPVTMHGAPVQPALACNSPINIQQVTPTRAVATGDFAVTEPQLQPLLKALSDGGITPTAVHSHLTGEEPRIYFVHFWGDASLADLLAGLKGALIAARKQGATN